MTSAQFLFCSLQAHIYKEQEQHIEQLVREETNCCRAPSRIKFSRVFSVLFADANSHLRKEVQHAQTYVKKYSPQLHCNLD